MNTQRLTGIILLVAGLALFFVGLNASHSVSDRLSDIFTGHYSDSTTWYLFGGVASAVTGLLLLTVGRQTVAA